MFFTTPSRRRKTAGICSTCLNHLTNYCCWSLGSYAAIVSKTNVLPRSLLQQREMHARLPMIDNTIDGSCILTCCWIYFDFCRFPFVYPTDLHIVYDTLQREPYERLQIIIFRNQSNKTHCCCCSWHNYMPHSHQLTASEPQDSALSSLSAGNYTFESILNRYEKKVVYHQCKNESSSTLNPKPWSLNVIPKSLNRILHPQSLTPSPNKCPEDHRQLERAAANQKTG